MGDRPAQAASPSSWCAARSVPGEHRLAAAFAAEIAETAGQIRYDGPRGAAAGRGDSAVARPSWSAVGAPPRRDGADRTGLAHRPGRAR